MLPILSTILPEGVQSLGERWQPPRISIWRNHWNWGWGHLLPPGVSQEFGRGEHEGALPQTPNRRVTEVGDLEGPSI